MAQNETILITGGSGFIGRHLSRRLKEEGFRVKWLGRRKHISDEFPVYQWDYRHGFIEEEAVWQAQYIIHLAGAGIGDRKWTRQRKAEILDSRINTTRLLYSAWQKNKSVLKAFISASAVGIYDPDQDADPASEEDFISGNFSGTVCHAWEHEALQFQKIGVRTVIMRTGIVLGRDGGMLKKLIPLLKWGLGTYPGSGKQWIPWIHVDDLCSLYIKAIKNSSFAGAYNAVAPNPVRISTLVKQLAGILHKPLILPPIPSFWIRLLLGEMSSLLLDGRRISANKILDAGFHFRYTESDDAIKNLFKIRD